MAGEVYNLLKELNAGPDYKGKYSLANNFGGYDSERLRSEIDPNYVAPRDNSN
jgi:hypothetical protein